MGLLLPPLFFCNFCSSVQTCTSLSRRTGRGRMPCSPPTPQRKPLKLTSLFCTAYHLLRISLRRQKLHVPPPSAPKFPLPLTRWTPSTQATSEVAVIFSGSQNCYNKGRVCSPKVLTWRWCFWLNFSIFQVAHIVCLFRVYGQYYFTN